MDHPPAIFHPTPAPSSGATVAPRIIVHGGAGDILKARIPPARRRLYRASLLSTLRHGADLLARGESALVAATAAVSMFENDPLFNSGRGAVFTRAGTVELEASVMVSRGFKKRAAAVSLLSTVKNPVLLARALLEHGEKDMEPQAGKAGKAGGNVHDGPDGKLEDGNPDGGAGGDHGSAGGHCHLSGPEAERLAETWGLELADPRYFWTKKRWDEHRRGLKEGRSPDEETGESVPTWAQVTADADGELRALFADDEAAAGWDGFEYLPQGTVGAVALDARGVLCVATSTGGLTNKLPGRIGDTPTIGAGFWAEEWALPRSALDTTWLAGIDLSGLWRTCVPWLQGSHAPSDQQQLAEKEKGSAAKAPPTQGVALSGTGNGDSFLRLGAARWTSAIPRLDASSSLGSAITQVLGCGGELQRSAGDRWGKTGEGEGGAIGIEVRDGKGVVVADYNCGGMFRAWVDDDGKERASIWREDLEQGVCH